MLYSPKWADQTADDPPSLEGLIAWLETQPADQKYDWMDCDECLVGRYITAVTGTDRPSKEVYYPSLFKSAQKYQAVAQTKPWTFGAALERARAAL